MGARVPSDVMSQDHASAITRDAHAIRRAVETAMNGVVEQVQRAVDSVPVDPEWETEIRADARTRTFGPSAEEIIAHRFQPTTWLEALAYIEEWLTNEQYRRELHDEALGTE